MGDVRFDRTLARFLSAADRTAELALMSDDEVVMALAAASKPGAADAYVANVLATEAMNRLRRASTVAAYLAEGVVVTDSAGRVKHANPALLRLLGQPLGELRGRHVCEALHAAPVGAHDRAQCPLVQAVRERKPRVGAEDRFARRDGTAVGVAWVAAPSFAQDEQTAQGSVILVRDLTDEVERRRHRETRQAILEVMAGASNVYAAAPRLLDAIGGGLGWDAGAFWILEENTGLRCAAFWAAPGVDAADLAEASLRHEYAPGDGVPGRVWERSDVVWLPDCEDPRISDPVRIPIACRLGLRAFLGAPCPVGRAPRAVIELFRESPIPPTESALEALRSMGASIGEFVERMRADERVRASETKYRSLFRSVRDAVVVCDTQRRITDCNPAFEDLTGHSTAELIGQPTRMLYEREDDHLEMGRALREQHADDGRTVLQARFRRKSGATFLAEVIASHLRDAKGATVGFIGVVRDVTERQAALRDVRIRVEDVAETAQVLQEAVELHALATGDPERAPDVPVAREAAEKAEAARRAAKRVERRELDSTGT